MLFSDMVVKSGTLDRMVYKGQAKEGVCVCVCAQIHMVTFVSSCTAINTKLAVADSCVKAPKSKSIK